MVVDVDDLLDVRDFEVFVDVNLFRLLVLSKIDLESVDVARNDADVLSFIEQEKLRLFFELNGKLKH